MEIISFEGVNKSFPDSGKDNEPNWAVRDLTFSVEKGQVVAVVGKTGCGKSTMFNLLSGLSEPTSGEVRVEGHDPYKSFNSLQGRLGIIFQNDRLMPWRTVIDNVCIGLELQKVPQADRYKVGRSWLKKLNLEGYDDAYPHELSGGMKQRVAIARAFSMNPSVLLCDEPFSALDEITAGKLRDDFAELVSTSGITAMFITHNIDEALTIASRVLVFARPAKVLKDLTLNGANYSKTKARTQIRKALSL